MSFRQDATDADVVNEVADKVEESSEHEISKNT